MTLRDARDALRRSHAARAGVAAAALILAAEAAVVLLAPGETGISPEPVAASEYFDPEELERWSDFRHGQRLLLYGSLAAQVLAVGVIAVGRPGPVREGLARLSARPVAGAAAAGALVVAIADAAALPAELTAHERAVDVGLSTQELGAWLGDRARGLAIGAVLAGAGAAALGSIARRWPRRWWVPGALAVVAYAAATSLLAPVVIAPMFNDFEELSPASALRREVVELGEQAGVEVGAVYRVDASRRSTALNAYVAGLGPTKRVVLYDNLIEDVTRPALRSVVAHELGHVANQDIRRGLAFVAIVAPFGLLLVRELAGALARRAGAEPGAPAGIPALLLAVGVVAFGVNVAGNQLSREVEASADAFALRVTGDPEALIDLQVVLARRNLPDVDPPALARALFGTHPTTLERIGSARAWKRG